MKIESTYRKLEDFDEVNIYDITEEELYTPAPQEYESFHTPFENLASFSLK